MAFLKLSDIGYKISSAIDHDDYNEYRLRDGLANSSTRLFLIVEKDLDSSMEFWTEVEDKISVLLYHGIGLDKPWRFENRLQAINFINGLLPRVNPNEKMLQLLEYLHSLARWEGEIVEIDFNAPEQKNIWRRMFFNSLGEFRFYIDCLEEKGWIAYIKD